uniref:Putative secreted protein ovary overexpressed n=1 Tax=Rhipicephalus microplus TaxID=6941 RepID=A0A6M2DBL4_RHIMP
MMFNAPSAGHKGCHLYLFQVIYKLILLAARFQRCQGAFHFRQYVLAIYAEPSMVPVRSTLPQKRMDLTRMSCGTWCGNCFQNCTTRTTQHAKTSRAKPHGSARSLTPVLDCARHYNYYLWLAGKFRHASS